MHGKFTKKKLTLIIFCLFIGISFLSFAELIELFVEIICIFISKKDNQTGKTTH